VVSRAVRLRTAFKVLGSVYLAYHGLAASWLIVEFFVDTRPGYWRSRELSPNCLNHSHLPTRHPRVSPLWRLHNCGGSPLTVLAVPVLLLTLVAAGSGCWLGFYLFRRASRAADPDRSRHSMRNPKQVHPSSDHDDRDSGIGSIGLSLYLWDARPVIVWGVFLAGSAMAFAIVTVSTG